jgi:hypothetical protein
MISRRGAFITWESTVPISSPTEAISLMGLSFFGQEARRFNGTNTNNSHWFLRECECRFSGGNLSTVSHVASVAVSENNLSLGQYKSEH